MKSNVLKLLSLTIVLPLMSACGSKATPPESFKEVLENNKYYNLYFEQTYTNDRYYIELNGENYYAYMPNMHGHVVLDSDPSFTHLFSINRDPVDYGFHITMHGRVTSNDLFDEASKRRFTFYDLIDYYQDLFERDENDPWKFVMTGYKASGDFKNFFQLSEFNFCSYYEINVNKKGKIDTFKAGEYNINGDVFIAETLHFDEAKFENVSFLKEWLDGDRKISERIADYKSFYPRGRNYYPTYENGEIDAIVTSIDYDGSFYVSNVDNLNGPIGMRVTPKTLGTVSIGDKVHIKAPITMDYSGVFMISPRFINAEVTVLGHNYPLPQYSEESIVDTYAPGIYAVQLLVASPMFGGSLYSGYGYAGDIPDSPNSDGDTLVGIYCPEYNYTATDDPFYMQLHLPKEYGEDNIRTVLDELRSLGDYKKDPENTRLTYFQNVICQFSFERELSLDLYALPTSYISHRLSFKETIEKDYGYKNFPELEDTTSGGMFHFGYNAEWFIESQYNLDADEKLEGVFSYARGINAAAMEKYFTELENYGAVLYDVFSLHMTSYLLHYIYTYKDLVIDISFDDFAGTLSNYQVFIYKSDTIIRCKTIEEKIDEACGSFFKGEEFIRLPGTHDSDYHFFDLPSFAGHTFEENEHFYVATLDITENRYDELRKAYRDAGWKQYRNPDNTAYSYTVRGNARVVYYKENANGKKTFLDFGSYPTSDYTFLRHEVFDPRIEIAIYEGDEPMKTNYTQDMTDLVTNATKYVPSLAFDWTLPSEYKAEIYSSREDWYDLEYGYCFNNYNAFIYPETKSQENIDELYDYIISVLEEHGFSFAFAGKRGVNYSASNESDGYSTAYFYITKNYDRGFVRVISSIGGADF